MKWKKILGVGVFLALAACIVFYFRWPHEDRSSTPRVEASQIQSIMGTPQTHDREHHEDRSDAPGVEVSRIQSIMETPQTYDGETRERLVALGPDAVPAIGQVLLTGVEFPAVLVDALKEIGDPRGAAPTLAFVKSRPLYSDADESFLTARVIVALGSMHNPDACAPLAQIFRDDSAHPRVQLAAASAASRLCEGDISGSAADLILEFYRNRPREMRPNPEYTNAELYSALAEVKNDTATDIIVEVVNSSTASYLLDPIISATARRADVKLKDALKRVVKNANPEVSLTTRLKAARTLLDLDGRPDDSLRENVNKLLTEAETEGYPPEIVAEALKLKQAYE
jgi:hypothetical protein